MTLEQVLGELRSQHKSESSIALRRSLWEKNLLNGKIMVWFSGLLVDTQPVNVSTGQMKEVGVNAYSLSIFDGIEQFPVYFFMRPEDFTNVKAFLGELVKIEVEKNVNDAAKPVTFYIESVRDHYRSPPVPLKAMNFA